jgi:hypothetical protein
MNTDENATPGAPGSQLFLSEGPYFVTAYPWWVIDWMPVNGTVFLEDFEEMLDPVAAIIDLAEGLLDTTWHEGVHFVTPRFRTAELLRSASRNERLAEIFRAARGVLQSSFHPGEVAYFDAQTPSEGHLSNSVHSTLFGLAVLASIQSPGFNGRWLRQRAAEAQKRVTDEEERRVRRAADSEVEKLRQDLDKAQPDDFGGEG